MRFRRNKKLLSESCKNCGIRNYPKGNTNIFNISKLKWKLKVTKQTNEYTEVGKDTIKLGQRI